MSGPTSNLTDDEAAFLRLSVDEVAVLCAMVGLAPPPAIAAALPNDQPPDVEQLMVGSIQRGLLARGILRPDQDSLGLDVTVGNLIALVSDPDLVTHVEVETEGYVVVRTIYGSAAGAVAELADGSGVLTYSSFDLGDLLSFVTEHAALQERRVPGGSIDFCASEVALASAADAVGEGQAAAAIETLVSAGVDRTTAATYVDALARHCLGARRVTTVYRVLEVLTTTVTSWSDCGTAGLWLVEHDDAAAPDGGDSEAGAEPSSESSSMPVRIRLVATQELLDRIEAGFPGPVGATPDLGG